VEFETRGKDILSGNSVLCTKGRCQGQYLGTFQPCDRDVEFSLVEAWQQRLITMSRLVLTVRADDGAGHAFETKKSVWINESVWQSEVLDIKIGGKSSTVRQFELDGSGDIVAILSENGSTYLFSYRQGAWNELMKLPSLINSALTKAYNGPIAFLSQERLPNQKLKSILYHYAEGQLKKVETSDTELLTACRNLWADHWQRLWCSTDERLHYFDDGGWQSLTPFTTGKTTSIATVLSDGRVMVARDSSILIHKDGVWSNIGQVGVTGHVGWDVFVEDHKGSLWGLSHPRADGNAHFYKIEEQRLFEFPAPVPLNSFQFPRWQGNVGIKELSIDLMTFNFSREQWETRSENTGIASQLGYVSTHHVENSSPVIAVGTLGFYIADKEQLFWPIKSLGKACYLACGNDAKVSGEWIYFSTLSPDSSAKNITRIKIGPAAVFDSRIIESEGFYALGSWINERKEPELLLANGFLYTFAEGQIRRTQQDLPANAVYAVGLSSQRLCLRLGNGLAVIKRGQNVPDYTWESPSGSIPRLCIEDASQTVWWDDGETNQIKAWKSGAEQAIVGLTLPQNETLKSLVSLDQGRTIIVATDRSLISFDVLTHVRKVVLIADLVPELGNNNKPYVIKLDDQHLLLSYQNGETTLEFQLGKDLATVTRLPELEKMGGAGNLVHSGKDVFGLMGNGSIGGRISGKWQILATQEQLQTLAGNTFTKVMEVLPCVNGQIWFTFGHPFYQIGRVDITFLQK